jgi:hypothetical protein
MHFLLSHVSRGRLQGQAGARGCSNFRVELLLLSNVDGRSPTPTSGPPVEFFFDSVAGSSRGLSDFEFPKTDLSGFGNINSNAVEDNIHQICPPPFPSSEYRIIIGSFLLVSFGR